MIFGVRHGERADYIGEASEIKEDPHLTKAGLQQAMKTGVFL